MSDVKALEERIERLEGRLSVAEAVQDICRLKARYGELVDARYTPEGPKNAVELRDLAAQIAALFAEDAVWDGGSTLGLCEGRDAIEGRFREPTMDFTWHFFVKPKIKVEDGEASGTWDIFAPCTTRDGQAFWMAGVEHDEYRRVDGAWLHTRMKLDVVFMAPYATGWVRSPS